MLDPSVYTVGWICAISVEYLAANLCLDEEHPKLRHPPSRHDTNIYTLGRIGEHNVVIASLPKGSYGTTSAATVASGMLHSFPNIRIGLMVGIGGGAPRPPKNDIRLGDIVVSSPEGGNGGVLQYDFGKAVQGQCFEETGFLNQPPVALRSGVSEIILQHKLRPDSLGNAITSILNDIEDEELQSDSSRPAMDRDRLYKSNVTHNPDNEEGCDLCHNAPEALVVREVRNKRPDAPRVHYGLIGSGNSLIKDATLRDRMATTKGILCFEMEAAGLMNDFPCLVIRGICDYSDSHKNDEWHSYAALAAAAYAKELLEVMPSDAVEAEQKIVQIEASSYAKMKTQSTVHLLTVSSHENPSRTSRPVVTGYLPYNSATTWPAGIRNLELDHAI